MYCSCNERFRVEPPFNKESSHFSFRIRYRAFIFNLRQRKECSNICRGRWRYRYFVPLQWNYPAILRQEASCYCWYKRHFLLTWSEARKGNINQLLFITILPRETLSNVKLKKRERRFAETYIGDSLHSLFFSRYNLFAAILLFYCLYDWSNITIFMYGIHF